MDSNLDIKYNELVSKYYRKGKQKLKQLNQNIIFKKILKPSALNQRKNNRYKLSLPTKNDKSLSQRNNSIIKTMKIYNNKNKFMLKKYKSLSINTNNPETIENNSNNERKKLVSSDILQEKSILLSLRKQFSINSLFNTKLIENKDMKMQIFKKNLSELDIKKKYSIVPIKEEKKADKKMTKFAMRNKLFFKYSSILSGGNIRKTRNENENIFYYKIKKSQENNKEHPTSSEPNNEFNFNNIYKRNLNLPNLKINKQIINNDDKIYINCLYSEINAKLNEKKLFPKSNIKSIYHIKDGNSYKRIRSLDKKLSKLLKET